MVNDYDLLRSVLDINNEKDVTIAKVLTSLQRDEIDTEDATAPELEEEYTPENTEGPPPPPPGGLPPGGTPPGRDEVCKKIFLSVDKKGKIPEPRMKRTQVFVKARWGLDKNGKMNVIFSSSRTKPQPIHPDSSRKGYFFKSIPISITAGSKMKLLDTIVDGNWISSYSTNPENIRLDFFENDVGQLFVSNPSNTTIKLIYILGIEKPLSSVMKHGKGFMTEIKNISISELKNNPNYSKKMSSIDEEIKKKIEDFLNSDPNPPKQGITDYAKWVNTHWNWFAYNKTVDGKKNDPCKYQSDQKMNNLLESSDNTFNSMSLRQGACRHKASGFFVLASYAGIPCRYVASDCHAFVEVWVPGIGWNMYDLGGCSPPGGGGDDPLDPSKESQETPDSPQNPPEKPNEPKSQESSLINKQIEAIVKSCKEQGINVDIQSLLNGLHEDKTVNKKKRFF
jgi:hypothetical protein